MTEWGYVRVSTMDQDEALQREALREAGIEPRHIYCDKASGATQDRPGLAQLDAVLQRGDRVTVWKLDRMGRNVRALVQLSEDYRERGIEFRSLTDQIDTTTPQGRFYFHLMASFAELERDLIRERTRASLAIARQRGRTGGQTTPISAEKAGHMVDLYFGGKSHGQIAELTGTSRSAVGRILRGEVASVAPAVEAAFARHGGRPSSPPIRAKSAGRPNASDNTANSVS